MGVGETAGTSVIGWDDSDSLRLGVYSSPTDTTISDLVTILSTGNVGIGTTSPQKLFHIESMSNPTIRIANSDTSLSDGQDIGTIDWHTNDADSPDQIPASINAYYPYSTSNPGIAILRFRAGTHGSANGGGFLFQDSTGATNYLIINPLGRVGIGTTGPWDPLSVIGDISLTGGDLRL